MATLTVWKFDDADGAQKALNLAEDLQKQQLIVVLDGAVVSWPEGAKKPRTTQLHDLAGAGALGGAFWGLLFGILFFIPLLGVAVGAAAGALGGSMTDVGIDDEFIKSVREKVTPGTSALFALTKDAVFDKVKAAMTEAGLHAELINTNLSDAQEKTLRDAFSES
jgi:uncharacterized membrane protein